MTPTLSSDAPVAAAVIEAIQTGDLESLRRLVSEHVGLATTTIDAADGSGRSLLHVATDWPGHFPNGPATVAILVEAGVDPNARFVGRHSETPLHWAASSNDVEVIDALLDAGADIEADGAVLGGGTPMADAVGFGQWPAARRLLERGAHTTLWQAAALGLLDRVQEQFEGAAPTPQEITEAFWQACHGGQRSTAEYLLDRGADLNWVGWGGQTALDMAVSREAADVVEWLRSRGALTAGTSG